MIHPVRPTDLRTSGSNMALAALIPVGSRPETRSVHAIVDALAASAVVQVRAFPAMVGPVTLKRLIHVESKNNTGNDVVGMYVGRDAAIDAGAAMRDQRLIGRGNLGQGWLSVLTTPEEVVFDFMIRQGLVVFKMAYLNQSAGTLSTVAHIEVDR